MLRPSVSHVVDVASHVDDVDSLEHPMSALLQRQRTHTCNDLTAADIGTEVVLMGWVQSNRDHHGRVFVDLRDRFGLTQLVFKPETSAAIANSGRELGRACKRTSRSATGSCRQHVVTSMKTPFSNSRRRCS